MHVVDDKVSIDSIHREESPVKKTLCCTRELSDAMSEPITRLYSTNYTEYIFRSDSASWYCAWSIHLYGEVMP